MNANGEVIQQVDLKPAVLQALPLTMLSAVIDLGRITQVREHFTDALGGWRETSNV